MFIQGIRVKMSETDKENPLPHWTIDQGTHASGTKAELQKRRIH